MYVFSFGTGKNIFERVWRINSRFGVCHTDYRGKSTLCGSKRSGMNVFFVGETRITEMHMCINKSWCNCQPGKIQNFFSILWSKVFTEF